VTDRLYLQDGKILIEDGQLKCGCCGGGDDPDPPWVCPDCPDWGGPGGPVPPGNPNGDPRCCSGDTICSANDDEPILIAARLTGSITGSYTHTGGTFPGVERNYSATWDQVFAQVTAPNACEATLQGQTAVTVPYWSRNATFPVDRLIGIQFTNTKWHRNRGFFGDLSDAGDDPVLNSSSGINIIIGSGGGSTGGAIVGTNNAGYSLSTRFCRSDNEPGDIFPSIPPIPRPDTFRFSQFPNSPIDDGLTGDTTTPNNLCLNKVTIDYTNEFSVGTNTFNITLRLYCFVSGVAPCLIA
jgi:hypothetical protein